MRMSTLKICEASMTTEQFANARLSDIAELGRAIEESEREKNRINDRYKGNVDKASRVVYKDIRAIDEAKW